LITWIFRLIYDEFRRTSLPTISLDEGQNVMEKSWLKLPINSRHKIVVYAWIIRITFVPPTRVLVP